MITVSLRIDEKTKRELDEMCDEMGMNITTFFMIYAKKALRERCIPFDIAAPGMAGGERETAGSTGKNRNKKMETKTGRKKE